MTLFAFLRHDAAERGVSGQAEDFLRELATRRALGAPRKTTNRLYYQWWKGRAVEEVRTKAREWWLERLATPSEALRPDVLARYDWHREQGHDRILLSGSFCHLIEPLAEALDATRVIATEPETRDGRFTGEIAEPMIGDAKRTALQKDAEAHRVSLHASHGYGDHPSDLPFLSLLGNPNLVTGSAPDWEGTFPLNVWDAQKSPRA